jgi:predicted dehydrogenase
MLARAAHLPNLQKLPEARLHTCCDLSDAALDECKSSFAPKKLTKDFRAAVADPEVNALIVATAENFRLPIVEAAVKNRKPVYCEKPLADTLEHGRQIHEMVTAAGLPFCVGHNRRCSPAMVAAQRIFAEHMRNPQPCPWRFNREGHETIPVRGQDGIGSLSIRINDDWHSWKAVHFRDQNAEFGLLLSEMTHFADLACWFMPSPPVRVFATNTGILNQSVIIEFAGGELGTIHMAGNGCFAYPKELLEVFGHGGVVVVDHMLEVRTAGIRGAPAVRTFEMIGDRHPDVGTQGGLHGWLEKKRRACEEAEAAGDPMLQFTAEPDKGHRRMLSEFIADIRGQRPPVSPSGPALLAMRICVAAIRSVQERRFVNLSELGAGETGPRQLS